MWVSLIVCVLVLGLTAYQVFTQGFFSALVMAFLSVVCAIIALNYHEPLAELLSGWGLGAWGPKGISLMALFIFSLLILRELTDRLVKGNMNFPTLVDRLGSAFFGFISSMVVAGMILIGFQNLDVPAVILGFDRCPELEQPDEDSALFPGADAFVVSLMSTVSNNGFLGNQTFQQFHPDYLRELYLNRLVLTEGSRQECATDTITKTKQFCLIEHEVRDVKSSSPVEVGPDQRLCGVRVVLDTSKRSKKSIGSADVDGNVRFTMGSFRLVCFSPDDPKGESVALVPVGILRSGSRRVDRFTPNEGKMLASSINEVDLLFRIPEIKTQPPQFLEFKRSARVQCIPANELLAAKGLDDTNVAGVTALTANLKLPSGIRTTAHILKVLAWVPDASDLPYTKAALPKRDALETLGITLPTAIEHVSTGLRELPSQRSSPEYIPLDVPNGYGLVYLLVGRGSGSRNQKPSTPKPILEDLVGNRYSPVGYAIQGTINDKNYVEFAYSNQDAEGRTLTPGQGIPPGLADAPQFFERMGRLQRMSFFFLIPRSDKPVGLVGVRMEDPTGNNGQFWSLEEGVDVVVVDPETE